MFLPGESQGRWSLVGCRLWGRTELDTTEATSSSSSSHYKRFTSSLLLHESFEFGGFPSSQTVKNPPAMQETWSPSLGREDPWRREWLTTPFFLFGAFHGQRSLVSYSPWGHKEAHTTERLTLASSVGFSNMCIRSSCQEFHFRILEESPRKEPSDVSSNRDLSPNN